MNASFKSRRLIEELAAHWTDAALPLLRIIGVHYVSVESELDVWRVLTDSLQIELRWQRAFRFRRTASLESVKAHVLRRTAALLARQAGLRRAGPELERRLSMFLQDEPVTNWELRVFNQIMHTPEPHWNLRRGRQTDFVPLFQLMATHD
jgi:hypothetical protein